MSCKVDRKDYTPEQHKAVEDFDKLIASKLGIQSPPRAPCYVYDPPPTSCTHAECLEIAKEKEKSQ